MDQFQYVPPLIGGALIGLSASILLLTLGRVAGVSGIIGSVLTRPNRDAFWRYGFLAGLIGIGSLMLSLGGAGTPMHSGSGPSILLAAGLLVGFGTRLGNGCTSGHGVCGLSRLSARSVVATAVFVATAMLVVFIVRHWIGGTA
jgi:uncharacterized membrane protein YedE/YeeE